jgi:hypothetical protein
MSDILCQNDHPLCLSSLMSVRVLDMIVNDVLLTSFLFTCMCSTGLLADGPFHLWPGSHLLSSTSHHLKVLVCLI